MKLILKKRKLGLLNNIMSFEASKLNLTAIKKTAKFRRFPKKQNFIINHIKSLRVKIILKSFKSKQF